MPLSYPIANYRTMFWAMTCFTVITVSFGAVTLYAYDKSVESIIGHMMRVDNDTMEQHTYLPAHYTQNITIPHSYAASNIQTLDDFYEWRDKKGGVLGAFEDRPSTKDIPHMKAAPIHTVQKDGYTLTKYTLSVFFDPEEIIFYELLPDGMEPYNAVFVIPGSGHGGAFDVLGEPGIWEHEYYQDGIAKKIVRHGYAVYVIELRGYGERIIDVGSACNSARKSPTCSTFPTESKMSAWGHSMDEIRTDEITQLLAWIESREYIDKIAISGLSLGTVYTANQAIINGHVVDAAIMASGISSALYSPLNTYDDSFTPIELCCDTIDQIATIAPMPAYTSYGMKDSIIFRWEADTGFTEKFLQKVYELHNKTGNFVSVTHDGVHEYDMETVLEFLDAHIGI